MEILPGAFSGRAGAGHGVGGIRQGGNPCLSGAGRGIRGTKTHGRRSVAGLNQMDNCLWKIPALVKKGQLFQPVHCHEVNRERCRMAGYEGYQYPVQCFKADMERMVAGRQDEQASFHDTILQQS
ncbi:hypothetical protein HMPREF1085_03155 [Enterocloster bolteae 90A9]|uniref:Uncharacterized protein n=2 Tax=Enterocloster bolteae TaxID=208479 RepID=R0ABK0_9FIRM|nr:hypothetical protein HMPREF1089_00110 [Enterocloster bolteae 90B3]ENZ49590.1 hypothetical protein HMPREF1085_03155 [Enterocloster bolteae 90A9]RGB91980.1 hypothetical protein DWZ21_28350 [Hungatella hathewayi]